jgi:hypothetical protein
MSAPILTQAIGQTITGLSTNGTGTNDPNTYQSVEFTIQGLGTEPRTVRVSVDGDGYLVVAER